MADTIRELVVKYGIDVDTGPMEQFDRAIGSLKGGLLGLGAVVVATAGSLFGIALHAAETGDEISKMAQRTGVGTTALQELIFRAKMADVEMDQLSQGITFLNRNMIGATKGSADLVQAFGKVGISVAGIKNGTIKADAAIESIGAKFAKMPDGPQKTALAMEIFGRAGASLIPFLNSYSEGLSEAQKAILAMNTMTEEQIEQAEKLDDSYKLLKQAFGGLVKTLGVSLLPVVTEITDGFTAFIVANKDIIKANLKDTIRGLSDSLRMAWKFTTVLANSFMGFARTMGGLGNTIKIVLGVITALCAGSILYGLGALVSVVYGLATAFTVANAAALLIPMLIGAAVLLVILIIDDLIAFFQGRDSVTGVIIQKFQQVLAWFQEKFPWLSYFIQSIFNVISAVIGVYIKAIIGYFNMLIWAGKLVGSVLMPIFTAIGNIIGMVVDKIGAVAGWMGRSGGAVLGRLGMGLNAVAGGINSVSGSGAPQLSPSAAMMAGAARDYAITNQTTINVPAGTDPTAVGPYVERGVEGSLSSTLRVANRAGTSGVRN